MLPSDLLLEDFRQQLTNLQNQFNRMHNRLQLVTGLNTALLAALGGLAAAVGKGDVGAGWLIAFPIAGLLLSAVGYVAGAADRYLVDIYRRQIRRTARQVLEARGLDAAIYETWGHAGRDTEELKGIICPDRLASDDGGARARSFSDRLTSWRWAPLSVTRLPAVLSLVFAVVWLVFLVVLLTA
jgi:hypothetical protein